MCCTTLFSPDNSDSFRTGTKTLVQNKNACTEQKRLYRTQTLVQNKSVIIKSTQLDKKWVIFCDINSQYSPFRFEFHLTYRELNTVNAQTKGKLSH